MGIDPVTHMPRTDHHLNILSNFHHLLSLPSAPWDSPFRLHSEATQLAKVHLLQNLLQILSSHSSDHLFTSNSLFSGQQIPDPIYNLPIGSSLQSFQNLESSQQQPLSCDDYTTSSLGFGNDNDRVETFYDMNHNSDSLPNLVSVSPECSKIPTAIKDNWDDCMDDESSYSYWKHVEE